ncbi:MAG: hypothetical protein M3P33_00485, partial [bacterium]|nr:hypothetical protein [bacterium]
EIPNLDDAVLAFFYGIDAYGNRFKDESGIPIHGFFNENGYLDEDKIADYSQHLAHRARSSMVEDDIGKPEKVSEAIQTILSKDISSNFFNILNARVNNEGKSEKKTQVLIDAFMGDASAAFTVAATLASGRNFIENTNHANYVVLTEIVEQYEEIFAENEKLDSPDESLLSFSVRWSEHKDIIAQTSDTDWDRRESKRKSVKNPEQQDVV